VLGTPATTRAQSVAAGVVELPRSTDTVAATGVRVLLHRVAGDSQGPIDSTISDARGRFRIRFRADSGALYLLSARYGGIEYFSSPVHTDPARPDTAIRVLVYDTSSTAPLKIAARNIVVARPGEDGSRSVLELLVLRNDGVLARVAADSTRPTWGMALPAGSSGVQIGESDLSPDAVTRQGDSVLVLAPIGPGDKQLTLQYLIPGGRRTVDFPLDTSGMVNVLVEERAAKVSGGTLALADSQLIEGRWFHRWSGRTVQAPEVRLTFPQSGSPPRLLLAGLVAGVALVLGLAAWRVAARRAAPPPSAAPEQLIEALVELDARYAGRESGVPAEEWSRYQEERARLKAALEAALAGVGASR
jgi:hypothetical protein